MGKICKGCGNFCKEENEKCVKCGEVFKDRSEEEVKVVREPLQIPFNRRPAKPPRQPSPPIQRFISDPGQVRSDLGNEKESPSYENSSIRVVLLGKTGAGKSATANSLLRKKAFKSEFSPKSVTTHCNKDQAVVNGKSIVVVDTPGLFDTTYSDQKIREELLKCIGLLIPGPNLFLIVLPFSRITQEELDTLSQIFDIFGDEIGKFSIIVFTRLDELQRAKKTVERFIEESDERLKSFIQKCQGRYVAINNVADGSIKTAESGKLARKVFQAVEKLGNNFFKNKMIETTYSVVNEISTQYEELCNKSDFEESERYDSSTADIIYHDYLEILSDTPVSKVNVNLQKPDHENCGTLDRKSPAKTLKNLLGLYGNVDPDFESKILNLKDEISILSKEENDKNETLKSLQKEKQMEEGKLTDEIKILENKRRELSLQYTDKIQTADTELKSVKSKRNKLDKEIKKMEKKIEDYNKYMTGDLKRLQQKADFQTNGCQVM